MIDYTKPGYIWCTRVLSIGSLDHGTGIRTRVLRAKNSRNFPSYCTGSRTCIYGDYRYILLLVEIRQETARFLHVFGSVRASMIQVLVNSVLHTRQKHFEGVVLFVMPRGYSTCSTKLRSWTYQPEYCTLYSMHKHTCKIRNPCRYHFLHRRLRGTVIEREAHSAFSEDLSHHFQTLNVVAGNIIMDGMVSWYRCIVPGRYE